MKRVPLTIMLHNPLGVSESVTVKAYELVPGLYLHRACCISRRDDPTHKHTNYWKLSHKSGYLIRGFTHKPRRGKDILDWCEKSGILELDWTRGKQELLTLDRESKEFKRIVDVVGYPI